MGIRGGEGWVRVRKKEKEGNKQKKRDTDLFNSIWLTTLRAGEGGAPTISAAHSKEKGLYQLVKIAANKNMF